MKIKWNEYTWYSKLAAAIFFIFVLPAWTFYVGMQYARTTEAVLPVQNIINNGSAPSLPSEPSKPIAESDIESCKDPQTTLEMNTCQSEILSVSENKMSDVYTKLIKSNKIDDGVKASIRTSQEAWLAYKAEQCHSVSLEADGGTLQPLLLMGCSEDLTDLRTKELSGWLEFYRIQ